MVRLVHFLGDETAHRVALLEGVEENLVAPLVELLDLFALHIGLAGVAKIVAETRGRQLARDALGDQLNPLQDQREVRDRNRRPAFSHEMTRECDAAHQSLLARAFARCARPPRSSGQLRGVPRSLPRRPADPSVTDPTRRGLVARRSTLPPR